MMRTMSGSMPKYSARPPQTPAMTRSSRERYRRRGPPGCSVVGASPASGAGPRSVGASAGSGAPARWVGASEGSGSPVGGVGS